MQLSCHYEKDFGLGTQTDHFVPQACKQFLSLQANKKLYQWKILQQYVNVKHIDRTNILPCEGFKNVPAVPDELVDDSRNGKGRHPHMILSLIHI